MKIKEKILIVDDDVEVVKLTEFILRKEGFQTCTAFDGIEALEKVYKESPDLLLLDLCMPRMHGYDVCQKLRKDVLFHHIPIIVLSGSGEINCKLRSFNIGADDYITKPFNKEEFLSRIKAVISRTTRSLDANPLTKLPGNNSITREFEKRIHSKEQFSVLYIDINHFKSFNDKYGFLKGDSLIRETARIIVDTARTYGDENDFIGHIGGDDFIVITVPERMHSISSQIIEAYDNKIPSLYDNEDRKNGYILAKNRQDQEQKFPLSSIAIGVVTNQNRKFSHAEEISSIGAELKKHAKTYEKSAYVVDRKIEQKFDDFVTEKALLDILYLREDELSLEYS